MLDKKWMDKIVRGALEEDRARLDVTSRLLVNEKTAARAVILAKQKICVCGLAVAATVFKKLDPQIKIKFFVADGQVAASGQKLMEISGRARAILAAERSALNFMQHLSGIATLAHQFVQEIKGSGARICDTRKTVPGLRELEKYAAGCGGATNHRLNLSDMVLVKDNHWKLLGAAPEKILNLKKQMPRGMILSIEVENDRQLSLALRAGADIILLDNLSLAQLKKFIARIRKTAPRTSIEVSGNVRLASARAIACLGTDRISVGALTHSAPAADISLELL